MNISREQMLKDQEAVDLAIFEKIKNNPKPEILELWALSPERFVEWRKINDYPVLLAHFDKTLLLFKEWKEVHNLTNEIIIDCGEITPFLEKKKLSNDKLLYLTKQNYNNKNKIVVAYKKLEGVMTEMGQTFECTYLSTFTSYLDWLTSRGKTQNILNINSRIEPNSEYERVYMRADLNAKSDFELLKMGGIPIPVVGFGQLFRGKKLEFVNLCGLTLKGDIYFGELGNLSCSYCACDNWHAEDFAMPLLVFEHCTVKNLSLKNSTLQQWTFYNSIVTGNFTNSKLSNVKIFGGNFSPIFQDCSLFEVNVLKDKAIVDNNYYAYKTLKRIYANQGEDDKAKIYFIKENEFLRKHLKGWNYITKSLSYYYWEYGRKPHRIIYLSLAIIFIFGLIYWINKDFIALNSTRIKSFTFLDGIYFSTTTFTTLGYGDFSPLGWNRIWTSIEAFLGVINMGFLIAGYSNNKY